MWSCKVYTFLWVFLRKRKKYQEDEFKQKWLGLTNVNTNQNVCNLAHHLRRDRQCRIPRCFPDYSEVGCGGINIMHLLTVIEVNMSYVGPDDRNVAWGLGPLICEWKFSSPSEEHMFLNIPIHKEMVFEKAPDLRLKLCFLAFSLFLSLQNIS